MSSSVLIAKLRPFILICQIYGLIPFSIEMDPLTGGFQRFTLSLKHFASWWYVFMVFVQFTCYVISVVLRGKNMTTAEDLGVSPIILSLTSATQVMYWIQVSLSRIDVLKVKRWRRVITLILEVEEHLSEVVRDSKDSIFLRTILGVLITTIMVATIKCYIF